MDINDLHSAGTVISVIFFFGDRRLGLLRQARRPISDEAEQLPFVDEPGDRS